jgi:CheY-like chemotaxis protein
MPQNSSEPSIKSKKVFSLQISAQNNGFQRPASDPPLILLVEDDPNARLVLRFSLCNKGYPVEEAEDGKAATEKLERMNPGLVLTDLQMPVMNGIALVQYIRRFRRLQSLPILVMTAFDTMLSAEALRSGADDTIHKPIQLSLLFQKIEALLSRKQL